MSDLVTLGLDPSLTATGYALVSDGKLLAAGVARTKPSDGSEATRQGIICAAVMQAVRECPQAVTLAGIETQHAQGGDPKTQRARAASAMLVAFVRGGLTAELRARGIPVVEVTPQAAKVALTGRGDATKRQMQEMSHQRFGVTLAQDAADALGIGLAAEQQVAGRQTQADPRRHLRLEATAALPEHVRRCIREANR